MKFLSDKTKILFLLDKSVIVLLGLAFLSIPLTYLGRTYLVWSLTALMLAIEFILILIRKNLKFDLIAISLISFIFVMFIGSSLTGFKSFSFTPFLNTIIILISYLYFSSSDEKTKKQAFFSIFLALSIFALIYIITYRRELLSLKLERLGEKFGDQNDIAVLLCLGFAISLFYIFLFKRIWQKIIFGIATIAFFLLSFTCGSKITILLILVSFIATLFFGFGKKRWWISTIIIVGFIVVGFLFLQLPALELMKDRLYNMIYTLLGMNYKGFNPDNSTIERAQLFENGISLFLRRPLFGFGTDGFATYSTSHSGWSHNHYSDSLCNYGIFGTLFYHLPIVFLFVKHKKNDGPTKFAILIMIFFVVSTISIALFKEKFFSYIAGLLLSFSTIESKKHLFSKAKAIFCKNEKIKNN